MDPGARVGRTSSATVIGVGLLASAVALAFFSTFDEPFALRGDNKFVHFPMKLEAWRQWASGTLPVWTNGLWSGFPLLGDATTGAFYLPHALAFLVTPDPHLRAFDVASALHVGWLAAGCVLLLRRLGCGDAAATLAAVLSLLVSHVLGWTTYLPGFSALAWWPWVLVGADRLARARARVPREVVLASLPLGAQVLAGYPETAMYAGCTAVAWILLTPSDLPETGRLLRCVALGGAATLLAGPQLVPGAYATLDSTRAFDQGARGLLSLQGGWLDVVDPGVGRRQPAVLSPFLGLATLALAAVAVLARAPRSGLLASISLLAAAAALGDRTPVYGLVSSLPFFELFRGPHKFFLITQLMVVWLAALGAQRLLRRGSRALAVAACVLAVAALAEHAVCFGLHLPALTSGDTPEELETSRALEILEAAAPVIAPPRSEGGLPPRLFSGSFVLGFGSLPMLVGAESLRGAGVALLSPRHQWLRYGYVGPRHLDLLAVDLMLMRGDCATSRFDEPVVLQGERFCIQRNPDARPRYELVSRARRLGVAEAVAEMQSRQPPEVVAVDAPPDVVLPDDDLPAGEVAVRSYRHGHVVMQVRADAGDRLLVARDSWTPGWRARVDGAPAAVLPAAGIFFAVPVPQGSHEVELRFHAPGLGPGLALGLVWLSLAGWALWPRTGRGAEGDAGPA